MATQDDPDGLYGVLGVGHSASTAEIKKAYHKAALSSHPDKVPEADREAAHDNFKTIQRAYEILNNDETRSMYDRDGLAAFERRAPSSQDVNVDDIFEQMFGRGFGSFAEEELHSQPRTRKGPSSVQKYPVTLAELYSGKSTKFAVTKNVVCSHCRGSGGRSKATPKQCRTCNGAGHKSVLRPVGGGLMTRVQVQCETCAGNGTSYAEKDRCKKCKGERVTPQKRVLELFVPRGARDGQRIVLAGEADQVPGQEPGDIVFEIEEEKHDVLTRRGSDLVAHAEITLAEALTGFERVILTHLDGRAIRVKLEPKGRVIRPGDKLEIVGEGMPIYSADATAAQRFGNLIIMINIDFPRDGWLQDSSVVEQLRKILPSSPPVKESAGAKHDKVVDAKFHIVSEMPEPSATGDAGEDWEEINREESGQETQQCATQ